MRRSLKTLAAGAAAIALLANATSAFAAECAAQPGAGTTVRPIEGTNLEEKFQHKLLYSALKDLGYEIADPQEVEYQTMHLAIANGDGDFSAVHWAPLHQSFFTESGGEKVMTKVGTLISGALQGYLVDKKSYDEGVTDISMLKDPEVAKRFSSNSDGKADLAGCVPGWGCERVIEAQLDSLGLRDTVTHNQGAYNAIIADTIAREKNGEPVLYYTWTPYWVSGVLVPGENVEWLDVPKEANLNPEETTEYEGKNLGFAVNTIGVVANNDFLAKNPAANKLFEEAKIDINDISAQNQLIQGGENDVKDIDKHVTDWIAKNQSTYDGWVDAACSAAG